jgi:hypothetical protein
MLAGFLKRLAASAANDEAIALESAAGERPAPRL